MEKNNKGKAKSKTNANTVLSAVPKRRYWVCIIGDTEWNDLPNAADLPMRIAVEKEFKKVTGIHAEHNWSGWSADEKAVQRMLKAWH